MEFSGDSESDAVLTPAIGTAAAAAAADDDDAESCSGRFFDDDDGEEEEEDGVDERWMSWRSWLMENAAAAAKKGEEDEEGCSREDGMDLVEAAATAAVAVGGGDVERDRVFWEACLARGY